VLAAAVPLIFLHTKFLPGFTVAGAHANLADAAVLAVAAAALAAGVERGFQPLRAGRALWIAAGVLLLAILLATLWGHVRESAYPTRTHLVTAAKFGEYALLAPALPLLLRARRDVDLLLGALAAWSCLATLVGILQFLGLVHDPFRHARLPGVRAQSFLGTHDFAALSCAALAIALAAIALPSLVDRRLAIAAGVAGAIGLTLSAAVAAVIGMGLAAAAVGLVALRRHALTLRRALSLGAVVGLVALGALMLRGHDLSQFLKFLGIRKGASPASLAGSSYSQRSVLAYIGVRIFRDHPVLGVGWEASNDDPSYRPYLADARRRFPDVPAEAFPSPVHRWGVQNGYLQAAADMGVIGFAIFVGLFATAVVVAARAALRGGIVVVSLLWILMAAGIWLGLGLVAGIPLEAFTWLGIGLAGVGGE
jgi:O-antigen ligase